MQFRYRFQRLFLLALPALVSCGTLKVDYVQPDNAQRSTVRVTTTFKVVNGKVLVHGADVCDPQQARVAAILTQWDQVLIKQKEAIFDVPAGRQISISMPANIVEDLTRGKSGGLAVNTLVAQPVATFTPDAGRVYEVQFSGRQASIYVLESALPNAARTGAVNPGPRVPCGFTTKDRGDSRASFYLTEPGA